MKFSSRPRRAGIAFKPEVCVLEERLTPAAYRHLGPPPPPPPSVVTHLMVIVPANVQEGQAANVTVEALNFFNHPVPSFRGAVQVSLGTADPNAVLPTSFTFSASDKGVHKLQATFGTPGLQTVIASDGGLSAQGSSAVHGVATHFAVYVQSQPVAGYPTIAEVVALDANNNIVSDYRGTAHLANSDVFAGPLDDYTFQAADNGVHDFALSFATIGPQTLTATDDANHALIGKVSVNVLSPWSAYPMYGWTWW